MKKILLLLSIASYSMSSQDINEIKFQGLTQISNEIALETLKFNAESDYSLTQINEAIKKFYAFNYFNNIWTTDENNVLTFHFVEKPFIAKLDMKGYKTRDDELESLYMSMGLKKGTMYTPKKLEKAKQALLLSLEREGYINSIVETSVENISQTSVAVNFEVNKGTPITVTNVSYKGVKSLDINDIEDVIANKETDCCFTWFFGQNDGEMNFEQLSYDSHRIRDLYLQHGYLDAKVTPAFSKVDFNTNTASIEYTIEEGNQYKVNETIIYLDETIAKVEDIYPELKLDKGDIFDISKLRKDQEYIKTTVANKGYAYTNVNYDIKPDKINHTVNLVYNVLPGEKVYIDDVIISGNSRTLDRVIRRNIYLAPKDLYNLSDLRDSKSKLKRTSFFESVEIKEERTSANSMTLLVTVKEAPTGNFIIGGGYGSYDGFMVNASVNDKNLFGSGLNLGFSVDHSSKRDTYNISLQNPAINDSIYSGSVNLYNKESLIENTDITSTQGDETTNTSGFSVGVGRSIGRYTRTGATYALEKTDVTYELDSTLNNNYVTSAITPFINYNSTDDYYTPRSGMAASTSLKVAGIGGDAKYMLSATSFKYFHSLDKAIDKDWIIRYKTNIKLIQDNGNLPDDMSFSLGGVSSVRGYESYAFYAQDGEDPFKKTWTNNLEFTFPLIPSAKMRWGLFYDYGMIGSNSFNDIKRSGAGALVEWISPVGPLQFIFSEALDAQYGDKTSSFEFSLGSKF